MTESVEQWTAAGPNRFYFKEMYDSANQVFDEPPIKACNIGKCSKKQSTKLKSKSKKLDETKFYDRPIILPPVLSKLKTLDVFAGCGGEFGFFNEDIFVHLLYEFMYFINVVTKFP